MDKKILVILGHPRVKSYCGALAEYYVRGAKKTGAQIKYVKLSELKFNALAPKKELTPVLKKMQDYIHWAEHVVLVYPTWWGGPPALLKGFIDCVITPGFAFRYKKDRLGWHKLLKGRSARIITTSGGPWILNHIAYRGSHIAMMKWATLWFSGFWPIRVTEFRGLDMKSATGEKRKWNLEKCRQVGIKDSER